MPKAKAMTLNEFKRAFANLKKRGWIPSKRKGPTGIGQTLEQALGLKENNIAVPDLKNVELKAHRVSSSSLITLFTFNRKVWKMKPLEAIHKYGTPDQDGRMGLYFTMSRTPNSTGLFLHIESETISVRHVSGEMIAEWNLETLAERFMQKLPALILVGAFSEMRGDVEWFKYDRARLLRGTSANIISSEVWTGNVMFDVRLTSRLASDAIRFLVNEDEIIQLFREVITL